MRSRSFGSLISVYMLSFETSSRRDLYQQKRSSERELWKLKVFILWLDIWSPNESLRIIAMVRNCFTTRFMGSFVRRRWRLHLCYANFISLALRIERILARNNIIDKASTLKGVTLIRIPSRSAVTSDSGTPLLRADLFLAEALVQKKVKGVSIPSGMNKHERK